MLFFVGLCCGVFINSGLRLLFYYFEEKRVSKIRKDFFENFFEKYKLHKFEDVIKTNNERWSV